MSTTPQNFSNDQEIDLSQISKKIGQAYESFLSWIFRGLLFVKKYIIILLVLILAGGFIGYLMDRSSEAYKNEIIVTPNYGSTDYLYSKIDLLQAKIKENDTVFLEKIGIKSTKSTKNISFIAIEPIVDVYKFVDNKNEQNFELIKLMAESGDLNEIIENKVTSRNYPQHIISFITKEVMDENKIVIPIMDYLNDTEFYTKQLKTHTENIKIQMSTNDSIIKQIDVILNQFSKDKSGSSAKSSQFVYYSDNTQPNELIKTKEGLVSENAAIRMRLVNMDNVIKLNSSVQNIQYKQSLNGKLKFLFPILFVGFFVISFLITGFYKRQMIKLNAK